MDLLIAIYDHRDINWAAGFIYYGTLACFLMVAIITLVETILERRRDAKFTKWHLNPQLRDVHVLDEDTKQWYFFLLEMDEITYQTPWYANIVIRDFLDQKYPHVTFWKAVDGFNGNWLTSSEV